MTITALSREAAGSSRSSSAKNSSLDAMHHLLGQSVFEVKGDEAWGETFFIFHGADRRERVARSRAIRGLLPQSRRQLEAQIPAGRPRRHPQRRRPRRLLACIS